MKKDYNCSSCGLTLVGLKNTIFPCPECGKTEIGRCKECRDQGEQYECTDCGFRGP